MAEGLQYCSKGIPVVIKIKDEVSTVLEELTKNNIKIVDLLGKNNELLKKVLNNSVGAIQHN